MDISGGAEGLLAQLRGSWRVVRAIWHADGTRVRFSGTAKWVVEDEVLRCLEAGEMVQEAVRFAAQRETLWRADRGEIDVTFSDGRPFHRINLGAVAEAWHECAPDTYRLRYDFRAKRFWSCRWRVTGPRKDYRALTFHWRCDP